MAAIVVLAFIGICVQRRSYYEKKGDAERKLERQASRDGMGIDTELGEVDKHDIADPLLGPHRE